MDNYVTKGGSEQRSKRLKARRVIPSMLATNELKKGSVEDCKDLQSFSVLSSF